MKIAQINVTSNYSTGRIACELCTICSEGGHQTLLCHARGPKPSGQNSYRIGSGPLRNPAEGDLTIIRLRRGINWRRAKMGRPMLKAPTHKIRPYPYNSNGTDCRFRNQFNTLLHVFATRLTDRHGFLALPFLYRQTFKLIEQLESFGPDIVHLHNIHGYYLYFPLLFEYLKKNEIPVVWTLHDCWSYTGHCAYYSMLDAGSTPDGQLSCERWKTGCRHCPLIHNYPASWLIDNSAKNWADKKALFTDLPYLVPVVPSKWLYREAIQSFWKPYANRMQIIPSGIDLLRFHAVDNGEVIFETLKKYGLNFSDKRYMLLSVASVWEKRKGIDDLIALSQKLGKDYRIVCIGLDQKQINAVPKNTVVALPRTDSIDELCAFYTAADLYISASYEETQGMTLVEALACGTQVLCYQATALPEIVTESVGAAVQTGNIDALASAAIALCEKPKCSEDCLLRAQQFDARRCFSRYLDLYQSMVQYGPHHTQSDTV